MKLTVTFILVAFGSMLASAAEPAVISSATSVVSSSASAATSKVAVPTPPAPIQAAPTPADKTKITIPLPKSPVVPNHNIRPPHHHWFGPGRKPFRPIPRPYGYPPFRPNPYLGGGQQLPGAPGALREKRSRPVFNPKYNHLFATCLGINGCGYKTKRSIPEASVRTQVPTYKQPPRLWNPASRLPPACGRIGGCGPNNLYDRMRSFNSGASVKTKRSPFMICYQLGGCGGGSTNNWWRRPKRSILPTQPALRWPLRTPPTHILRLPFYRRPAQKRSPIIAPRPPFICAGLNCGGVRPLPFPRRPFTWPVFKKPVRVNARSAEPEPVASTWCNPETGSGCGGGFGGFGGSGVGWRHRQGGLFGTRN